VPEKDCAQKMDLLRVYQRAALQLVNTLTNLQQRDAVRGKIEYDVIYESLESLKGAANGARADLESHVHEHGC